MRVSECCNRHKVINFYKVKFKWKHSLYSEESGITCSDPKGGAETKQMRRYACFIFLFIRV
jgi:hypothetical protein